MPDKTASHRLAAYVADLVFDDIPESAVSMLKRIVLHDLAVAIGGSRTDEAARALAFIDGQPVGGATVIASGRTALPVDASFANSVLIRALRQEDTMMPGALHSGALVIPPALAFGQVAGVSGREVVTAMIAGYQVMAAIAGDARRPGQHYRTPSQVYGAFGPAAVVGKLLAYDVDQLATAIAYAGNSGALIGIGFENHQYGVVVRNGVVAAQFGQVDAPAPDDAIEGDGPGFYQSVCGGVPPDLDERLDRLSANDAVEGSYVKRFPCTGGNQISVALLRGLLAEHGIEAAEITAINITRPAGQRPRQRVHDKGPWPSPSHTISSLPFQIGATLLDGDVTASRLYDRANPEVYRLAQLVHFDFKESSDREHRLELHTTDGRSVAASGGNEVIVQPDPQEVLAEHALDVIGPERVQQLTDLVNRLEELDSVDELRACIS